MDTLILDAIVRFNKTGSGGANFIHLEQKFPEMNSKEISKAIRRLIDEGEVEEKNYLFYPKKMKSN